MPVSEEMFKKALHRNSQKLNSGSSRIYLKDIFTDVTQNFGLMKEGRWVRFIDSENLKIITKAEHIIFSTDPNEKPTDLKGRPLLQKTFIIQLGKQNLINIEKLGFKD